MRSSIGVLLLVCGLALIHMGCAPDAPHDNPLDPKSPDYKNDGRVSGSILSMSFPYSGVSGALVTVLQNGSAQLTAADGSFSFPEVPSGNIMLVVTKTGYLPDTVSLNLPVGANVDTTVHVDALPQITGAQVFTTKIDQWWPGAVYFLNVTANVSDADGAADIVDSTVRVDVDTLSFKMSYSAASGNYSVTVSASQIPGPDLQWLVGKQFFVSAADRENGFGKSTAFYISRIIESEPGPTSPTSLDTTSAHPLFEWGPPGVSYAYTYFLQVYQINAGTPSQVGSTVILDSKESSYSYPDSLSPGQYFWTIGITDSYGNSSRSREASFIVP